MRRVRMHRVIPVLRILFTVWPDVHQSYALTVSLYLMRAALAQRLSRRGISPHVTSSRPGGNHGRRRHRIAPWQPWCSLGASGGWCLTFDR
jgi:hypothetical protein